MHRLPGGPPAGPGGQAPPLRTQLPPALHRRLAAGQTKVSALQPQHCKALRAGGQQQPGGQRGRGQSLSQHQHVGRGQPLSQHQHVGGGQPLSQHQHAGGGQPLSQHQHVGASIQLCIPVVHQYPETIPSLTASA